MRPTRPHLAQHGEDMHVSNSPAVPTHHNQSAARTANKASDGASVAPPPPHEQGARSTAVSRTAPPPSADPAKGQLLNTYV